MTACTSAGITMMARDALSISPYERSRSRLRRTRQAYGVSKVTIWRSTSCNLSLRGLAALLGALITPIVYQSRDMGQAFWVIPRPEKRPVSPSGRRTRGYRYSPAIERSDLLAKLAPFRDS